MRPTDDERATTRRPGARAGALLLLVSALALAGWCARSCRAPTEPAPEQGPCHLAWQAAAERLVCVEAPLGGALMPSTPPRLPVEQAQALGLPFDINAASAENLQRIRGIGQRRAAAIVALREARGGFCTIDELAGVRGIGPATVERLRAHLYVTPTPRCTASPEHLE